MCKIYQKSIFCFNSFAERRFDGFTLIELLVVVVIISILAAIALPKYQTAVLRARYQQMIVVANSVVKGQKLYYMNRGMYSKSFDELDIQMPPGGEFSGGGDENEWLHYPWGFCYLTEVYVQCQTKGLFYEYHYNGARFCIAKVTDSSGNRVCSTETGRTDYVTNSGTQGNYYSY